MARAPAAGLLLILSATTTAQQLKFTTVSNSLANPIGVRHAPFDRERLFVLERAGRIVLFKNGVQQATPFLDLTGSVFTVGEAGLLGLAFHPDYAHNGRFFVSFTDNPGQDAVVREYSALSNPDVSDPASGIDVFGPYPNLFNVHYAGDLAFGPDGKLYYAIGDWGFSQSLSTYDGKLVRLDVDRPFPHVPIDNPFASPVDGSLDMIWARGLRNPYRFTFDALTGDLLIGDVGGDGFEEVDFQPRSALGGSAAYQGGRNYGWPCMEGFGCRAASACTCDLSGATLVLPAIEFPHAVARALIGGYVYRGHSIAGLHGQYLCGDYITDRYWTFRLDHGLATQLLERTSELCCTSVLSSFGTDADGEIYATTLTPGRLMRLDGAQGLPLPAPIPYCATSPNTVGFGARIDSTGSASISANELTLLASRLPPLSMGVFFMGTQAAQLPFGNGVLCVGGALTRMPVGVIDEDGRTWRALDFAGLGITAGDVRQFQLAYRDAAAIGATFNASDAVRVTFLP